MKREADILILKKQIEKIKKMTFAPKEPQAK